MSYVRRLAVPGVIILAVFFAVDVAYVKAGQPESRFTDLAWWLLYLAIPVTFFLVLRSGSSAEGTGKAILVALVASLGWLVVGGVALAYFHISIGGSK